MKRAPLLLALCSAALLGCAVSSSDAADASLDVADSTNAADQVTPGDALGAVDDVCAAVLGDEVGEPRHRGQVLYLKRMGAGGEREPRPVRRAALVSGELTVGETDDSGCYDVPASGDLRVEARASLNHFDVRVEGDVLWSWSLTHAVETVAEDYAAGAFNVLDGALRVDEALSSVVPPGVRGEPLLVRWGQNVAPGCGSCFYVTGFTLELTGAANDEDGHDDSVFLHELGHYVEAAFGTWSNPGGGHDLEAAEPTLAWSEGFATWFQAALRQSPDYVDVQPGRVYRLDLEEPPLAVRGTLPQGSTTGRLSEGLVYGVLWDLIDAPTPDDDAAALPLLTVLAGTIGVLGSPGAPLADAGYPGADLVDALRRLACASDRSVVVPVAEAFEFPWTDALCDAP